MYSFYSASKIPFHTYICYVMSNRLTKRRTMDLYRMYSVCISLYCFAFTPLQFTTIKRDHNLMIYTFMFNFSLTNNVCDH